MANYENHSVFSLSNRTFLIVLPLEFQHHRQRCACIHTHTYTHIHMPIHTCPYTHAHTHMPIHTCPYTHAHTHMPINTCTYTYACKCTRKTRKTIWLLFIKTFVYIFATGVTDPIPRIHLNRQISIYGTNCN